MKSERRKKQQNQFQEKQTIIDTKTRNNIAKLLTIAKINNERINKIDEDLNSNPFTKIFKSKTVKQLFRYLISFLVTALVMILILVGLYFWVYQNENTMDRIFDILGNGFYWILAGLCYFGIDYLIAKKGRFNEYAR